MVMCNCIVQDGQISEASESVLRAELNAFSNRHFGEAAEISWVVIPKRSGFTAGAPSTSAVVSLRAPTPVQQADRETLLRELCGFWIRETNTSLNEIVGVISDPVAN